MSVHGKRLWKLFLHCQSQVNYIWIVLRMNTILVKFPSVILFEAYLQASKLIINRAQVAYLLWLVITLEMQDAWGDLKNLMRLLVLYCIIEVQCEKKEKIKKEKNRKEELVIKRGIWLICIWNLFFWKGLYLKLILWPWWSFIMYFVWGDCSFLLSYNYINYLMTLSFLPCLIT